MKPLKSVLYEAVKADDTGKLYGFSGEHVPAGRTRRSYKRIAIRKRRRAMKRAATTGAKGEKP